VSAQLRIPGPTIIPERVARAASRPMVYPHGAEFGQLLEACTSGVARWLGTESDILLFPASGTGGLEAAVANLLSPGEHALFCTAGYFGELWADIARAFGAEVVELRAPWGRPTDLAALERALADERLQKVFVTHHETSTGVLEDLPAIAALVKRRGRVLAVDTVSGAPCHPLDVDGLGIDVAVAACQKGWLAPPGLAMIAVNQRALHVCATATSPRAYFDWRRQHAALRRGRLATTPPISVMYALEEGLAMLREEGREQVWQRHTRLAHTLRLGLRRLGLRALAAPGCASDTVTVVPSDVPARALLEHGLVVADGLGRLEGRAFRIGHLGPLSDADVAEVLEALERTLCIREAAA
jgi:aspartate aminotransferase-like enzyme